MKGVIKALALLVLVVCAVWLGMLWHWDQSGHSPTTADAVRYLVLLPLFLFAGILLLHWAWRAVLKPGLGAAAAAPAATGTPAVPTPPSREELERHRTHPVLAAHLRLNAGSSGSEVRGAIQSGEAAPGVDAELRNAQGLPILAARIADLDPSRLDDSLRPVLQLHQIEGPAADYLQPATLRALAALHEPLQRAASELSAWHEQLHAPEQPQLRLLLQVAQGAPALDAAVVTEWVQQQFAEAVQLPLERIRLEPAPLDAAGLWQSADRLLQTLHRERRPDLVVLVAAQSHLDAELVERWEAEGRLFDAQRQPKGLMPGEGAAVLVLGHEDWPAAPDAPGPLPHIHRPVLALRDKSIEAPGKVGSKVLEAVLEQALALGRIPASSLGRLVCDADRHGPRNTELFGALIQKLPQLDAIEDVHLLGASCGHLAGVGALAGVALAAQHAAQANPEEPHPPSLVLALNDVQARLGLLVRLGAPPAAAQA